MTWASGIALIALIFSITCFGLFLLDAIKKPRPDEVADRVRTKVMAEAVPGLDPRILGELAKALAAAFSKIGPGLVALIGAALFLLLSGEAVNVYNLTGSASEETADGEDADGDEADDGNTVDVNGSNEADPANGSENETAANGADNAT